MGDPPTRYDQTITLPDGRKLGYAEAGSPTGYPLIYFHGFPSCRLEARGLEEIGHRHNIRLIAMDRPGFGLSTFQPNRRITDYPADVEFLAQHMGFERFAVLGGSGGGPYALACANGISPEKLSAAGMMATAATWEAGTKDVWLSSRVVSWMATYCPSVLIGMVNLLVMMVRGVLKTNTVKTMLDAAIKKAAVTAGKTIAEDESEAMLVERRNRMIRMLLEPFAQGSRGPAREAYLLTHPYGFRLEDVSFNKVKIWHGTKDSNSPIRMVRYMRDRIPHCELKEYEGVDHYQLMKYLEEIVTELIPEEEMQAYVKSKQA